MTETELREALMLAWMQTDKAYIALAKAGIAAHEAGNREAQNSLETVSRHVWTARTELTTAMNKIQQL